MADFNKAYAKVKGNEGGYANVDGDKGGETYMGISRVYNPGWKGWSIVDAYKAKYGPIKNNFRIPDSNLDQMVKDYYRSAYWNKMKGDNILNQAVAENFFDMFVNSGSATKIMQKALVKLGFSLDVDNMMGMDTLTAINKANPSALNSLYIKGRKAHYDALVRNDPSQEKFYDGWMSRLEDFKSAAAGISTFILLSAIGIAYYFFHR